MTLILGLESSCDETAAAVVEDGLWVRSHAVATQHHLHEKYGGVVPEIASRAHLESIVPVLEEALAAAGATLSQVDAVAVGNRPGLIGSLLVGVSAAKALAWISGKPLLGVDHVQAHLYAGLLHDHAAATDAPVADPATLFPALGLVVSGGHTSLYQVESFTKLHRLGRTIDDAVGEAYDKAAVILGLPYPGGPNLDKLAQSHIGPLQHELPRSLLGPGNLDFSFSGLKTALLYAVRGVPQGRGAAATFARSERDLSSADRADLAAAFQEAAIGTLVTKLKRALAHMSAQGHPARALLLGGGVSANSLLRKRATDLAQSHHLPVLLPSLAYCLDNAAMIAGLTHPLWQAGQRDDLYLPALASSTAS